MPEKHTTRIDKWLWTVRIYKTRSMATAACTGGKVKIDGKKIKASRMITIGDIIQIQKGIIKFKYEILKISENRMGAKLVNDFIHDLTPTNELDKLKVSKNIKILKHEKGKGRPTKKERRILDEFRKKI